MLERRRFLQGLGVMLAGSVIPATGFADALPGAANTSADPSSGLAPPPKHFSSNHNYFLYAGGAPIQGLTVTIEVTADMVSPTGLNLQLNAYSPAGANCTWQQYCMGMSPKHETRLGWSNENFPSADFRWKLHNTVGSPCGVPAPTEKTCKGDIFNHNTGEVGIFPSMTNRIPAGSRIIWELISGASGEILGATYSFVDPKGHKGSSGPQLISSFDIHGTHVPVGADALAPILTFQLNIVGLNNGAHATLSSGAGRIIYEATTPLTAEGKQPAGTSGKGVFTEESSNIVYQPVPAGAATKIVQPFAIG